MTSIGRSNISCITEAAAAAGGRGGTGCWARGFAPRGSDSVQQRACPAAALRGCCSQQQVVSGLLPAGQLLFCLLGSTAGAHAGQEGAAVPMGSAAALSSQSDAQAAVFWYWKLRHHCALVGMAPVAQPYSGCADSHCGRRSGAASQQPARRPQRQASELRQQG